ncbi:MAG: EAL domain-containing protein [Proteobacteria bacterium]|nr:EAL domain-containing protein [Burkholderiales bacterium]
MALDHALATSDQLASLLFESALAALTAQFAERERASADSLQSEFIDAMQIGRFALRVTDGLIVQADEAFAGFLGTDPSHLIGVPAGRFIPVETLREIVEQSMKSGRPGRAQVRTLGVDRAPVTLDLIAFMQQAADRDELQCLAVNVSAADREVVQRRLLSAAIEASNDLVLITDPVFKIVYANPAFVAVTGYEPDEVIGRHPQFLQGRDTPGPTLDRMLEALAAGQPMRGELVNYRKDGTAFWIDLSVVPVTAADASVEHWVSVGRDVSERKQAEQEITRLAMEDHLTGLPNRRAAEARLQLEWNRARRNRARFALALADVDRFKLVNDQHGHEVGDRALRHLAQLIQSNLRGGDWVARWGGEEFVICFHDLDAAGALAAGERMRRQVKGAPLDTGTGALPITVSLGISVYRPALDTVGQMLAEADGLLYEAKQGGRDQVLCAGETEGRRGSVIWEGTQVQSALRESRVVAAFQPIVDLRSGAQVGVEALARIIALDNTVIPAAKFIEAAESLQLAASIDEAISAQALARGASRDGSLARRGSRDGSLARGASRDGSLPPGASREGSSAPEVSRDASTARLASGDRPSSSDVARRRAAAGPGVPAAKGQSDLAPFTVPLDASLTCFINLSPQFLASRESVDGLIERATCAGISTSGEGRFVVGITERQGGDLDALKKSLAPLVDAGFRLALDDFGSGYSSFQYLADLPIRYLKIEGWMVSRAVTDSRIRQLLETIVATAQKFKLITVAECVEEASTAKVLRDLGVDWAQGYFFGAPAIERDPRVEGPGAAEAGPADRRRSGNQRNRK